MGEADKGYWLLSETSGIGETRDPALQRHLPVLEGLRWLAAGWRDFWNGPSSSLAYGVGVFVLSVLFVWTLVGFGRDYILFPALAGFLIVAPFLAIGLYEKSRAIGEGRRITLGSMLRVRPRAGAQVFFTGLMLSLLMLLWTRAAVLLWSLFFGVTAFPGIDHVVGILWDGTNANVLYDMVAAGEAPNVARLLAMGTGLGHGALASLPSVTLANHTTILTGAHPGHHGILHNAWYDRASGEQVVTNSPATWPWSMQTLSPEVETLHQALHRALVEHVSKPEFCYFHKWRKGDLVIWDNRVTLHKAEPYDMGKYRRVFRRTTLAGSGPVIGPFSRPSLSAAV